jgi:hypothetical protein
MRAMFGDASYNNKHANEFKNIFIKYQGSIMSTECEAECLQYIDKYRDFYNTQVYFVDTWRASAIIFASYFRYDLVVLRLIANGADINITDSYGDTALIDSCYHGRYDVALKLIDRNANINIARCNKRTALSMLCSGPANQQQLDVATALIDRGVDINVFDGHDTPLTHACLADNSELAIKLIDSGAQFVKYIEKIKTRNCSQIIDYIIKKYNESIFAAMNDEQPNNMFATSFKKTYVPQLVNIIVAFIL